MAQREKDERIIKIHESGGKTYSISRLNTIHQCPYQAYLNYVKHIPQRDSCYSLLGTVAHDTAEGCIHGKLTPADMKTNLQKQLDDLEVMGIEFPKDRNGGDQIKDNWVANMMRFADEFETPKGDIETEQLLTLKIDDSHWMIGYADAIRHNPDGSVWLIDFKTSSMYVGPHLKEAGRQLAVYCMALRNLGYEVKRCSWVFFKYCETKWTSKTGKQMSKVSEWRNLAKDMKRTVEKTMLSLGYDFTEIDIYISKFMTTNRFDCLPDDVKSLFSTGIYIKHYEITDEVIDECMEYIKSTIDMYESFGEDESNWKPCDIENESFFCHALCGYGGNTGNCKYYVEYLDKKNFEATDDSDLF